MPPRALVLLVAVAAAVVVGCGLAALADAPPNDACSDFGTLREGSTSSSAFELWPPGVRCEYESGGRVARAERFGPSSAELYAWILAAALVVGLALLRRESASARGVVGAAALLAVAGLAWMYGSATAGLFSVVVLGVEVAFALDRLLRPAAARSFGASLRIAVAVASIAFGAVFLTILDPFAGIAIGLLGGGLASGLLARSQIAAAPPPASG